jgi:putative ABC transport system substrate-binding protein
MVAGLGGRAEATALLSYSGDDPAHFRRAVYYVDRILKGATPSDLPIEQPTTFQFVVNLKTTKIFGLAMPRRLWCERHG